MMRATIADFRSAVADVMPIVRADLEALIRIPSCAFAGFPREHVYAGASETVRVLRDAGVPKVDLLDVPGGEQAVYGRIDAEHDSPRVLLYAHYDVQPAGDLTAWKTPPFEPTEVNGRLYGRGAADDKSGIVIHAGALRVLRQVLGEVPVSATIVVEGEEECGGPLPELVRARPELFDAQAMVIADVGNLRIGEPTFTTGLRGLVDCVVEIRTLAGPVHSGMFGGPAPDALLALIRVLDTLRDADGSTAIAGVPQGPWLGADYPEPDYRTEAGIEDGLPLWGNGSLSSRLFSMPSVNVIGIDAPSVDGAINAVIPYARAKVSLRIPPGASPDECMEALVSHLRAAAPLGVQVDVTPGQGGAGFAIDTSGPAYVSARRALADAYGRPTVEIGSGGTIPLVAALAESVANTEVLLFGAQDPRAHIHAPNESVDLKELELAVLAEALFLARFGGVTFADDDE